MRCFELIKPDHIILNLSTKTKEDLFRKVVRILKERGKIEDEGKVLDLLFKRENIMSTGIGNGIAIPHASSDDIKETKLFVVILKEAIDYNSIDGLPVRVIFLLMGPSRDRLLHLKILARIARIVNHCPLGENCGKSSAKEILDLIFETDKTLWSR